MVVPLYEKAVKCVLETNTIAISKLSVGLLHRMMQRWETARTAARRLDEQSSLDLLAVRKI